MCLATFHAYIYFYIRFELVYLKYSSYYVYVAWLKYIYTYWFVGCQYGMNSLE